MQSFDEFLKTGSTNTSTIGGLPSFGDFLKTQPPVESKPTFRSRIKDYAQASAETINTLENAILHPIQTIKKTPDLFVKPLVAGEKLAGEGLATIFDNYGMTPKTTVPEKVAGVANVISGLAQSAFSPITGLFTIAENTPGLKQVADLINVPFSMAGLAGAWSSGKIVDAIPDSILPQASKDIIKQPIQDVGNLAFQVLLGGKVMEKIGGFAKDGKEITPQDAKKIIVQSQNEAHQIAISTPGTRYAEYRKKMGYEPYTPPEQLPTIDFGAKAKETLPTIPKVYEQTPIESPLLQEARKYKSAEEFVKAQPNLYHGTSAKFDAFNDSMRGSITGAQSGKGAIWFTDDPATAKAYSIYAAEDGPINKLMVEADRLEKIAQKSGLESDWKKYDAITQEMEKQSTYDATFARRANANVKEATVRGDFLTVDAKGKTPQELSADGNIDSWLNTQLEKARKAGKDGVIFKNLDDAVGLYDKPSTHYAIFDSKNIITKSQLTDIWNKAQGEVPKSNKLGSLTVEPIKPPTFSEFVKSPEAKGEFAPPPKVYDTQEVKLPPRQPGVTKTASDINQNLVKQGFDNIPYEEQAKYTPQSYKEIATHASDLLNNQLQNLKDMMTGKAPLSPEVQRNPEIYHNTLEAYARNNPTPENIQLLRDMANANVSQTSRAGQILGGHGYNDNPNSPIKAMEDIKIEKVKNFEKSTGKKYVQAEKTVVEETAKASKNVKVSKESWSDFIQKIKCSY